jgi:hypothetical protein
MVALSLRSFQNKASASRAKRSAKRPRSAGSRIAYRELGLQLATATPKFANPSNSAASTSLLSTCHSTSPTLDISPQAVTLRSGPPHPSRRPVICSYQAPRSSSSISPSDKYKPKRDTVTCREDSLRFCAYKRRNGSMKRPCCVPKSAYQNAGVAGVVEGQVEQGRRGEGLVGPGRALRTQLREGHRPHPGVRAF